MSAFIQQDCDVQLPSLHAVNVKGGNKRNNYFLSQSAKKKDMKKINYNRIIFHFPAYCPSVIIISSLFTVTPFEPSVTINFVVECEMHIVTKSPTFRI